MDKGAHFYRCDFQVHSPRDPNWTGPRPTTPKERDAFADRLIATCRARAIGAIAITDHHDFAFVPVIRAAALREVDSTGAPVPEIGRISVFPGLELTLGVPCQALLILDADFPDDRLSVVLDALALPTTSPEEATAPGPKRIEHVETLQALHDELDKHAWLRGRYILLPNVTDGGLGTLMRSGMQGKYKDMPCVGGYLDGTVEKKIGDGNRRIFDGTNPDWGNKRIAVFQTSDSRDDAMTALGEPSTWVKWTAPTAEALRQACLAQESRITQNAPQLPALFVTRLSVSNSQFMGPIELELNPQYNALIGGRGTGKSTCLEYLRWALCDQPAGTSPEDELSDPAARRERLIATTLTPVGAHVEVHFSLNGVPHAVRRRADTGQVLLRLGDGDYADASPDEIRALLPIQAFSQKQLSSVSVRLDELMRFVTAPIRGDLDHLHADAERLADRLRENYAAVQRYRNLGSAAARDELTLNSVQQQAVSLRESLTGVSDEDRLLLAEKGNRDRADASAKGWERRLTEAGTEVNRFRAEAERLEKAVNTPADDGLPDSDALERLRTAVASLLSQLSADARAAAELLESATTDDSEHAKALQAWDATVRSFGNQYAAATARSVAHESQIAELGTLEARQSGIRDQLEQYRAELEKLGDPIAGQDTLRGQWRDTHKRRADQIEKQCDSLNKLSGGLIRATLGRGVGFDDLVGKFRAAITGSGVRGAKIEAIFDLMRSSDDPITTWESLLTELEPGRESATKTAAVSTPTLFGLGLSAADVGHMKERITPDGWLDLALTPLRDRPSFDYQTKPGEYIPFSSASAGQQATALLTILLNQAGPPLVIDQPEDDLDSQIVLEIVEQIWQAKTRRQLVFASHNPNLVVNGDAELLICCDYRAAGDHSGGRIKLEGAIDVPKVKAEITTVMEGGEKAFRLRKEKYGF